VDPERRRLEQARRGEKPWRRWGAYLAERQWGTVREDYSADGEPWGYFPYEMSLARAYRWGEDGLAGISDDRQLLCASLALWNGRDPHLKERLFGLSGPQGNHGEDVKELYWYLDATPTHSWLEMLYRYPQAAYPYARLVEENRNRGRDEPEFEITDSGALDEDRFFDVRVRIAKAAPEDLLIRIEATNRGPDPATLHVLPQLWFRNVWSWGSDAARPRLSGEAGVVTAEHPELGTMYWHVAPAAQLLFCDNESDAARLWGRASSAGPFKDAIHRALVGGEAGVLSPTPQGTKVAAHHRLELAPGASATVDVHLSSKRFARPFAGFERILATRRSEADMFYAALRGGGEDDEAARVQRQAWAGLIWSQQLYRYDVPRWLTGDPGQPAPPAERRAGRNHEWTHFDSSDILSMPDTWEYPWFAAWDLAFHCVALARVDPELAKRQLVLLCREWYMHPNGQLPAYEWNFGDVNPPVHAWAAMRVYEIDRDLHGRADRAFLERVFHKLMLNFTWWVNREDPEGRNVFQGGFLGLDNIGLFDRSMPLPGGGRVDQADATSWMAMYSLNLMRIALELARVDHVYEDIATKFFEHFLYIAAAMREAGGGEVDLWDEQDEFFYDVLHRADGGAQPLRVRSVVGLIPLCAVEVLEPELLDEVPEFRARLQWFLDERPDLAALVSRWHEPGKGETRLLALLRGHRMKRVLARMLDESEFLSDFGVRSLSRVYGERPYELELDGRALSIAYQPGESDSGLFGGNSNWRGPVWMPVNYLLWESLQRFHRYYGDDFRIECPAGSGRMVSLAGAADELARRLVSLFLPGTGGRRPVLGALGRFADQALFREHPLFFECFHGEDGRGVGASHQTGWSALVAELLRGRTAPVRGGDGTQ